MKKVCTIIVTHNGEKWIEKCIQSLIESDYLTTIMIVDNNSSDNTLKIASTFDNITIIEQNSNLGFGKANNVGILKGLERRFDYMFLLNQDTFIFHDTIGNLINEFEGKSNYGIISPLHYSPNLKDLDENFQTYLSRKCNIEENFSEVNFVNAAAWMISKDCLIKVGLFEEWFSHYGEDRNYCHRVIFHNFKIGISHKSKIVHDRIITRNFNKDKIQAQYSILGTFLNINLKLNSVLFIGLKQVFGLPKYFYKYYNINKIIFIFISLKTYYIYLLFNLNKLQTLREKHKKSFYEK